MSKLTKQQAKLHAASVDLLKKDRLTDDEREFVLTNWQASAQHINSIAGAFFTPTGLARDLSLYVNRGRVVDLCAGIGALALNVFWRARWPVSEHTEIVCVEKNPDYAAVGQKLLPEARWIVGSVFDLPADLGRFDFAISNPPFGAVKKEGTAPRFTGRPFEYHVIDIASDLADYGVFILPQMSVPFKFDPGYESVERDGYRAFSSQTGIELTATSIDCSIYESDWQGVSVSVELAEADFTEARLARASAGLPLFARAA